ncbi:ABC transporter substrate-binding protein [Natrarchaeobaculum sulfurireducens]|uniref:ABC-type Fe3+-siderophore transport system, periplasmic component n=1 Tax=Natrarchaeobaculum sulfurireducens TaxID=2044521 RepID=A0A346PKG9_9EURY|nr:ABC transporter substrate-binding protein [Natrarchaeobaculum sulfurireducens]AXR80014.1 ABC-type Fe3+-siderophore transport system, periplasmic component [Natrarchaeobaculum sulfurireducens]
MHRRSILGAVGSSLVVASAGCFDSSAATSGKTLVDLAGRSVSIPESLDRIVAVGPGCLRLVVQLGAADLVVGVERDELEWRQEVPYNLATPSLSELEVIGGDGGDFEQIVALEPDLICSTGSTEAVETLADRTGLPVVGLTAGQLIDVDEPSLQAVWETTGKALDRGDRVSELNAFLESVREDLRDRVENAATTDSERIYATGISFQGGQGLESTRPRFEPFELLGEVDNVAAEVGENDVVHVTISPEQLLQWDPDLIVVDRTNVELIEAELAGTPSYRELTAVSEGEVYGLVPHAQYGVNHSSALASAYYVGSLLYPEAFADVEIERRADEIYEAILGRPIYDELVAIHGGFGRVDLDVSTR